MPKHLPIKIWKSTALPKNWLKRARVLDEAVAENVKAIINKVAKKGDAALIELTERLDGAKLKPENLRVSRQEIKEAYGKVNKDQIAALKQMKSKVSSFEKLTLKQFKIKSAKNGITIQTVLRPIESVGCYVPGGQAAYPSTVIMTAVPAKTAGVSRIVVCTPPTEEGTVNPLILVAADICEVSEIYKIGGAQAIAALANGTETVKPVKKIVGPGNKYVTMAKILVSNEVAIDMPAGPSEILALADETANPQLIALDMISQAEHGTDSVAGLITTSWKLAEEVASWLSKTATSAERGTIVKKALTEHGFIITCEKVEEMIDLTNAFAPEHVEIMTQNPMEIAKQITSAGIILIGPYSPVPLSDYASGTNHVLPTSGFAHAFSGLSVLDFARRVSIIESSKEGLLRIENHVKALAEAENLPNHYKAIEARFQK